MPETLTETELKEIEREADRLPTDYLVIERVLILDYYTMKEASAWTGHTQPAAKAYASVPALCRSLRAAWAERDNEHEAHLVTVENLQETLMKHDALRAQLAQAQARIEKLDAIVSAYENQDEEALAEAENL